MIALTGAIALFGKIGALFSGIDFAAILPAVGAFFGALTTSIAKYWQYYLIGLLALLFAGSAYEWRHTDALLKTEKAARAADIKSYKDAQAAAQKAADAEKAALTQQSKEQANAADKNYSGLLATYRANLLRYEAAKGGSGRPDSSEPSGASQGVDGPSASTVFPSGSSVTISADDANICATNTARLQAGHDWAVAVTESNKTDEDAKQ